MNLFPENGPVGQCERCYGEIYNYDNSYNGVVLCRECREYIDTDEAIIDFACAYPGTPENKFQDGALVEYFRECGISSDGGDVILAVLRDFRDWMRDKFDRWVVT